jgi:hypothetical protein
MSPHIDEATIRAVMLALSEGCTIAEITTRKRIVGNSKFRAFRRHYRVLGKRLDIIARKNRVVVWTAQLNNMVTSPAIIGSADQIRFEIEAAVPVPISRSIIVPT